MRARISRKTLLLGSALLVVTTGVGCSRHKPAATSGGEQGGAAVAEAEPIHDTIQEFRKGERIACAAGTDLVYVVSRDGGLHSFDPSDLRFRRIGTLECPNTRRALPHSMAVDRSGQAWVGYDNGVVALASIANAECTSSRVNVQNAHIGRRFGMGFAPTPEGGIGGETLFLTTEPVFRGFEDSRGVIHGSSLLARIDDGAQIKIAGEFPPELRGLSGELSSRSDGKLFAFFTGDPFQVAEINPTTADILWRKRLDGMRFSETGTGSWAFAAVGSEFFFFWADRNSASTVSRLKEDGTIEHVVRDSGMEIVGAGASTCATSKPLALPKDNSTKGAAAPAAVAPPTPTPTPTPAKPLPTFGGSKLPPLPPPTQKAPALPKRKPISPPRVPPPRSSTRA